jgi:hypothetical protein
MKKSICASAKIPMCLIVTVVLTSLFLLQFGSCTALQESISTQNDASLALSLPDAQITTYRFDDIMSLRIILRERIGKYRTALGFLKKQADLYKGTERVPHDRRISYVERKLNILAAQVENLELIYREEWNTVRLELSDEFKNLHQLYRETYEPLL